MADRIRIEIKGVDRLLKKLKTLVPRVQKKVHRQAVTAAVRPLRNAAKALTLVGEGDLSKSMASKVTSHGFSVNGIVGSDMSKIDADGQPAARHLHLVNNGFQHVDGQTVPGVHMLERASEQTKSQSLETYENKLREGIEREAGK